MPGLAWLLSAAAFAVAMAATPGPNNAMLTTSGATWGFQATVPHMLGISIGFPVMLTVVALGTGNLLLAHSAALDALRWLGAGYLLWLAWKIATAVPSVPSAADDPPVPRGKPFSFWQAALYQWVNPKAWIIVVSALTTLGTTTAGRPSLGRALIIAVIFLGINVPVAALWTGLGVGVAQVLRTPRALRRFNVAMAALLVASLITVLSDGA